MDLLLQFDSQGFYVRHVAHTYNFNFCIFCLLFIDVQLFDILYTVIHFRYGLKTT